MRSGAAKIAVETAVQLTPTTRLGLFLAINAAALLVLILGTVVATPQNPRLIYAVSMVALCTSPILSMERINGRFFLLALYLAFAFVYFGFSDIMFILTGRLSSEQGILSGAECVILASLAGVAAGYHGAVRRFARRASTAAISDWSFIATVVVGLIFWAVGTASKTYWQVFIVGDRSATTLVKNLSSLGQGYTTLFMISQLVQPLGIMILAYAYTVYRRRFLFGLIVAVTLIQVIWGFIADIKSEAMLVGILVIITKIYVEGRLPKAWLVCAGLFVVIAFPIFQAQRLAVRNEQGRSAADTLNNVVEALQKSIDAEKKISAGFGGAEYRVQAFWERASLKSSVALIVDKTGNEVPYQAGATLAPILTAFIPRILWSGKDSLAVGQMFNKSFNISEDHDVYISPSHIGEVYWNFGWIGIILIMPSIGFLLGFIGARCVAFPRLSLTQLLVMFVTIFSFVVRAEGSIATEYVVWLRSMAVIGILHMLLARRASSSVSATGKTLPRDQTGQLQNDEALPFPNLLR